MSEPVWMPRDQVDEAGETLRRHGRGERVEPERLNAAFDVLDRFRREWETEFSPPLYGILRGVANDLIGIARPLFSVDVEVSHRLKRTERIIDKLVRIPRLRLSELQDIGGCRVVLRLRESSDVPTMLDAIRSHCGFRVRREDDYVAAPKRDGYRAHHIVVESVGHPIEIQIRTLNQQHWANAVERIEQASGVPLRGGKAPAELADALRATSEMFALADRGQPIPWEMAPRLLAAASVIDRWSKMQP